jgi:hypothetical protein
MSVQRLDLGPEPHLKIGTCSGTLQVRGSDRTEIKIDGMVPGEASIETSGSVATIDNLQSSVVITIPEGGTIELGQVKGDLDIKDITGAVLANQVSGNCMLRRAGRLSITGSVGGTLRAREIDGPTEVNDVFGDCLVRQADSVTITGVVRGSLEVRDINEPVQAGEVLGNCSARQVAGLTVGAINGEASIRAVEGGVTLGSIGGEVTLRDIEGPVTVEAVGGDLLGRNVSFGIVVSRISGDLALRTGFKPETQSRFDRIAGDATIRIPANHNVRFVMPAGTDLHLSRDLETTTDGEQTIVTSGESLAAVTLSTGGSVIIKTYDPDTLDEEFAATFDDEFDAYWETITTQIEERLETNWDDLPERVRTGVEAKLDSARRHMQAAQRKAEQAIKRAGRHATGIPPAAVGPVFERERSKNQPISDEERLAILHMLETGKISVQEAQELLSALEGLE